MNGPTTPVVVIGGGPAGSVAAARLAGAGIQVVMVDAPRADGPAYDVVVSEATLASLDLPTRPVDALRLRFGRCESRLIAVPELYACDQATLRERLIESARAAGATVINGRATLEPADDGRHRVLVKDTAGTVGSMWAAHIVVATGAPDVTEVRQSTGVTVSGVLRGSGPVPESILYFAAPPPRNVKGAMASAWVIQGPGDTCTLTATSSNRERSAAQLFADTLSDLALIDPYFASLDATRVAGATTNLGFSPQTCLDQGRILIGDAAGLTNPFTGEGISYAVQSGAIAADCIAGALDDPTEAGRRYREQMSRAFVGYFETARHATRRYQLAWRTLASTLTDDSPFCTKARRAMILPEGLRDVGSRQEVGLDPADSLLVKAFTAGCDALEVAAIRTEWPFLVRMLAADEGPLAHRLRPAVPFLAAVTANGCPPPQAAAPVAAGIELATLAVLAFVGSPPAPDRHGRGIDWARATTVLVGDFLLGVAAELVAGVGDPALSWAFADWVRELTALRTGRLSLGDGPRTPAAELFGALFEFPCRAGAELAGLPADQARRLRRHGYHSGQAFLYAEDLRALNGRPTRLDTTHENLLHNRVSSIPDLIPDWTPGETTGNQRDADRLLRDALADQVPRSTLTGLDPRSTRILTAFTQALAET
ncbi:FAD-dependent monooxygenase [Kribbella sp. NPDC051952]|uniref:FAD-dependent monooxygenase n=1 Tax=Kribbella sp. NPDC051952 TaxID=3154851 RepID=UPI00343C88EA